MRLKIIAVLAAVFMVKAGLALASDFSLCRFPNLVLPSEVQVFAADLEGGAGLDWLVQGGPVGLVKAAVNSPDRPAVLILAAHEAALWHIGWTEGTRILAVAVIGPKQTVFGLPSEAVLLHSSFFDGDNYICPYPLRSLDQKNKNPGRNWGYNRGRLPEPRAVSKTGGLNQASQLLTGRDPVDGFGLTPAGRLLFGPPIPEVQPVITAGELKREDFDLKWPLDNFINTAIRQKRIGPAAPQDYVQWVTAKNRSAGRQTEIVDLPSGLLNETNQRRVWAYVIKDPEFLSSLAETLPLLPGGDRERLVFFIPAGIEAPESIGKMMFLKLEDGSCLGETCRGTFGGVSLDK